MFTPCCFRQAAYAAKPLEDADPEGEAAALSPEEDPQAAVRSSAAPDASNTPPWRIRMMPDGGPPSWSLPQANLKGSATPG
jgi:hypothetical protein